MIRDGSEARLAILTNRAKGTRVHREQEANEHAIDRGEALNRVALPGPRYAALRRFALLYLIEGMLMPGRGMPARPGGL